MMKIVLPVLLFLQLSAFAGTAVPKTEKCPAHEVLSQEESELLLDDLKTNSQAPVIEQYQLTPQVSFTHNNAKIILSKRFSRPDKDRQHALAFIQIGNTVYPRVFYHSNSHGTFRVIDGVLGGWYSKGPGQAFISIPFNVSKFLLNGCIGFGPKRTKKDLLALSSDHLFYYNDPGTFDSNIKNSVAVAKLDLVTDGNGSTMRQPQDIEVLSGFEPDFTKVITRFKTETKAAGVVDVFVYRSKNNEVEYMIMKGGDDKIWVAEVNTSGVNLNKFGIANSQYYFEDLLQPRWEYPDEVAIGYGSSQVSPHRPKYHSNWNYLREITIIQDWYKASNIALPPKEL